MLDRIAAALPYIIAFGIGWACCLLYLFRAGEIVQVEETANWEQVPNEIEFIIRETEKQTAG